MDDRRELLRKWLRGRGLHISDIKGALDWWEAELTGGADHNDDEVLAQAEDGHRKAVREASQTPVLVLAEPAPPRAGLPPEDSVAVVERQVCISGAIPSSVGAFCGAGSAIILFEALKWLVSVLMR